MVGKQCTRYLFKPPTHQRDDMLMGFGFGTIFLVFAAVDAFALPYALLPLAFLSRGAAEALPVRWIVQALILRVCSLACSIVAVIWFCLMWSGWLPQ